MLERIIENSREIAVFLEFVVVLFWIYNFHFLKKNENLFFFIFLLIFSLEIYLLFLKSEVILMFYNTFIDGVCYTLFLIFYQLILNKTKKTQIIFIIFYVSFYLYILVTKDNFYQYFNTEILIAFSICLFLSIVLLFYEIFNSNIILNITSYLPFWISCSLMVSIIASVPIFSLINKLSDFVYRFILLLLNSIGYILLIIGIMKSKYKKDIYLKS